MARPGFYNDNKYRAYPFQLGEVGLRSPGSGPINLNQLFNATIVDCGFIMGPESGFKAEEHFVYLYSVHRLNNDFYFEFRTTAPLVTETHLVFGFNLSDSEYSREFVDSDIPVYLPVSQSESESVSVSLSDASVCGEPFWSGYLVIGDLTALAARLDSGETIVGEAVIEPALIQNLNLGQVVSLNLANADRTRALAPFGCDAHVWPFTTGQHHVVTECLQGDLLLRPGYNMSMSQNAATINFAAIVNAGKGQPCEEIPLFDGEEPPVNSANGLLDGDFRCNEAFRTINGLQGPEITLLSGTGVSIRPSLTANELVIDVNLNDLSLCDFVSVSESL